MPVEVNSSEQGPGNTYLMNAACPLTVGQVNTSVHSSYILHVQLSRSTASIPSEFSLTRHP